ncbi:MAG: YciI family protein [Rubricoccaceae bacterium]|nr:YciI family protein [Rubricoccaceae bacterium]
MNDYLLLHIGFEPPSPEVMAEWEAWFASVSDREMDRGHLPRGWEMGAGGEVRALPLSADSLTGFTLIQAADLDEAKAVAAACPAVLATRVYEIRR